MEMQLLNLMYQPFCGRQPTRALNIRHKELRREFFVRTVKPRQIRLQVYWLRRNRGSKQAPDRGFSQTNSRSLSIRRIVSTMPGRSEYPVRDWRRQSC